MKSKTKHNLLIGGALTIGVFILFGRKKLNEVQEVLGNLKVDVKNITNINFQLPNILFDVVISINNPTNINFGATLSSRVFVKKIKVYTNTGGFVGEANVNLYEIVLLANSTVNLPKANVVIEAALVLEEFVANIQTYLGNDFSNLEFKIEVEAFGKTITIDAN